MKKENTKNGFLITWVSCVVFLLMLCFLGVNGAVRGTYSAAAGEGGDDRNDQSFSSSSSKPASSSSKPASSSSKPASSSSKPASSSSKPASSSSSNSGGGGGGSCSWDPSAGKYVGSGCYTDENGTTWIPSSSSSKPASSSSKPASSSSKPVNCKYDIWSGSYVGSDCTINDKGETDLPGNEGDGKIDCSYDIWSGSYKGSDCSSSGTKLELPDVKSEKVTATDGTIIERFYTQDGEYISARVVDSTGKVLSVSSYRFTEENGQGLLITTEERTDGTEVVRTYGTTNNNLMVTEIRGDGFVIYQFPGGIEDYKVDIDVANEDVVYYNNLAYCEEQYGDGKCSEVSGYYVNTEKINEILYNTEAYCEAVTGSECKKFNAGWGATECNCDEKECAEPLDDIEKPGIDPIIGDGDNPKYPTPGDVPESPIIPKPSSSKPSSSVPVNSKPSSSNNNVTENPQTGQIAIFIIWIVGLATIGYSVWYFRNTRKEN